MPEAKRIAIVGAESTGKTTLALQLAAQLRQHTGQRVAAVPEVLRQWCEQSGRTPLAHEQAPILRAQHERIEAAAASHDIVVCDTTALMIAVYSGLVFADHSLDARAAELHQRSTHATLLTALDVPWVADGFMRDGPQVRTPVDNALRALMQRHGIAYSVVSGLGEARVAQAFAAVRPLLDSATGQTRRGLFTGLDTTPRSSTRWACECCVPEAEQALKRQHA
jgi:nicotinamide riboside kinase